MSIKKPFSLVAEKLGVDPTGFPTQFDNQRSGEIGSVPRSPLERHQLRSQRLSERVPSGSTGLLSAGECSPQGV